MGQHSSIFPFVKLCIWILLPSTLYCMATQIFLLTTDKVDKKLRPNSALQLTASILTTLFVGCWCMALSSGYSRSPPPSGKKVAFVFSLCSTIFWLAALWTGIEVAREQLICHNVAGGQTHWSDGLPCQLHRAGVAFSTFGFLSSVAILGSMIEISDRAFGGVSNEAKISWTAEKFHEALVELADPEIGQDFTRGVSMLRRSGSGSNSNSSVMATVDMQQKFGRPEENLKEEFDPRNDRMHDERSTAEFEMPMPPAVAKKRRSVGV